MKFTYMMIAFLSSVAAINHKKVLLKDVDTLVLMEGKNTKGRRSNPVPQLTCIGDCRGKPYVIVCKNIGSDGIDVVWECTADIHDKKFDSKSLDVSCEGWEYPDDPYVLSGSCGLTYRLKKNHSRMNTSYNNSEENSLGYLIIIILIFGLFVKSVGSSLGFCTGHVAGDTDIAAVCWLQ